MGVHVEQAKESYGTVRRVRNFSLNFVAVVLNMLYMYLHISTITTTTSVGRSIYYVPT